MNIKTMLKRTFSVVLAGAMSIAVFTACGDKDNKKKTESLSAKEMLIDVFDTMINSDSFSGVFAGKANTASKTEATIEFGEGITDTIGTDVKPLSLTSETKLKGTDAGTDISIAYDGTNLASINGVYDSESETIYIKVPELSDAYLSASIEDIKAFIDEAVSDEMGDLGAVSELLPATALKKLTELKVDEYEDILNDYIKVISDNLPDDSAEDDFAGTIGEAEYSYKAKTFSITADNAKSIVESVFDKLKDDEKVKNLAVSVLGSMLDITEDNYSSIIDEAENSILDEIGESTKSQDVCLVFDGKNIVGIRSDAATIVGIDRKDAYAISAEIEGINSSLVATNDNGKLDMDFSLDVKETDETDNMSLAMKIDDMKIVDKENGLSSGDAEIIASFGESKLKLQLSEKAETAKQNTEINFSVDDVEYAKIALITEITDASDITTPSGTIYTLDEIDKYQSSMKINKLLLNVQEALGDDLFASISGLLLGEENQDTYSDEDADEGAIMLEDYYDENGDFDYDKLKEDIGEENYDEFMSQIDIKDLEVDVDDIEF